MRKERRHGWSEGKRGREEASGGGREQRSEGEEQGRSVGGREMGEGGKLQGRYHEEDTDQYTVYSVQNNTQRGPCHCDFGVTNTKLETGIYNLHCDAW